MTTLDLFTAEPVRARREVRAGEKFGRLTVIASQGKSPMRCRVWACLCECGKETIVRASSLRTGHTKSCGCLGDENRRTAPRTHGHGTRAKTPTLQSWQHMISRCSNPNDDSYPQYGARGISVCERWLRFENFLADMGERPRGTSIDRIDGRKGYSPDNCRWATRSEQAQNTTRAKLTLEDAKDILSKAGVVPARVLAERYGVRRWRIYQIWNGQAWRNAA